MFMIINFNISNIIKRKWFYYENLTIKMGHD